MPPAPVIESNPTQSSYIDSYIQHMWYGLISQDSLSPLNPEGAREGEKVKSTVTGIIKVCKELRAKDSERANMPIELYAPDNITDHADTYRSMNELYKIMKMVDDTLSKGDKLQFNHDSYDISVKNMENRIREEIKLVDPQAHNGWYFSDAGRKEHKEELLKGVRGIVDEACGMLCVYQSLNKQIKQSPIYQEAYARSLQKAEELQNKNNENIKNQLEQYNQAVKTYTDALNTYFKTISQEGSNDSISQSLEEYDRASAEAAEIFQQGKYEEKKAELAEIAERTKQYGPELNRWQQHEAESEQLQQLYEEYQYALEQHNKAFKRVSELGDMAEQSDMKKLSDALRRMHDISNQISSIDKDFHIEEGAINNCYYYKYAVSKALEESLQHTSYMKDLFSNTDDTLTTNDSAVVNFSDIPITSDTSIVFLQDAEKLLNQLNKEINEFKKLTTIYNESANDAKGKTDKSENKDPFKFTLIFPSNFLDMYSINKQIVNDFIHASKIASVEVNAGFLVGTGILTQHLLKAMQKYPYVALVSGLAPYVGAEYFEVPKKVADWSKDTDVVDFSTFVANWVNSWTGSADFSDLEKITKQHEEMYAKLKEQIPKDGDSLDTLKKTVDFVLKDTDRYDADAYNLLSLVQKLIQYNQSSTEKPSLTADEKALAEECKEDGCYFYHAMQHCQKNTEASNLNENIQEILNKNFNDDQNKTIHDMNKAIENVNLLRMEIMYRAQLMEYYKNNKTNDQQKENAENPQYTTQLQQNGQRFETDAWQQIIPLQNSKEITA